VNVLDPEEEQQARRLEQQMAAIRLAQEAAENGDRSPSMGGNSITSEPQN